MKLAIFPLMTVLLSACSVFGVRTGYEQASYTVVERLGDNAEVRRYAPLVVAEATVTGVSDRVGRSQAFRLLFDYISGDNRTQARVAMTTPVETSQRSEKIAMTIPVERTAAAAGPTTMRFFLPAQYTVESAPQPSHPNVRIVEVPERLVAVLRFTGSTGEASVERHLRELEAVLATSEWRAAGQPSAMFYDPPWTLPFFRRNEVAVAVERRGADG